MTTPKILNAINRYYHQLNKSKRIISLNKTLGLIDNEDTVELSEAGKRKELISRLTRDIVNNLITAQKQPLLVQEIKQELENEYGHKLLFKFDPKEKNLTIRREDKLSLTEKEQEDLLKKLYNITYNKLNSILSM